MTVLDVARGAYVRLPASTRAYLGRVLQYVPTSMKFGNTYRHWREVIDRAKTDTAFVRAYREQALTELLEQAVSGSRYYAKTLGPIMRDAADGYLPGSEAWQRIPVLTRQTMVDQRDAMCTVPPERLDPVSTDGSSGEPLAFRLDRNRSPVEYAFIHDAWSRSGFTGTDWRAVFRGLDIAVGNDRHMEAEPALKELRLSVFHLNDATMAQYLAEIRRRGIAYIHGYPSAIAIFCEYLTRSGAAPLSQIKGILPISERLYPHQRELMERTFDQAVIMPFYGLSEKVAFAVERPGEPDTYEFNPIYGYTELLDEQDRPVTTPGRSGRIVSTGLLFRGMPLIRYDTRDEAELVELPSATNGYRLVLRNLSPRRDSEFVVGYSGTLIPFCGLCVPVDSENQVREVQFYQDTPGEVELRVVSAGGNPPDLSDYLARMAERADQDLTLHLKLVDRLPMTGRGKRKFIDQRLPVPHDM
jgi:phenylacetate-CoA ligase